MCLRETGRGRERERERGYSGTVGMDDRRNEGLIVNIHIICTCMYRAAALLLLHPRPARTNSSVAFSQATCVYMLCSGTPCLHLFYPTLLLCVTTHPTDFSSSVHAIIW